MSLNDRFALYIFGNENNYEKKNKNKDNENIYINYIKNNNIKKFYKLKFTKIIKIIVL